MVLLTPVIRIIKEKYPESEIHVLAGKSNYLILKDNTRVDKLLIYNKSPLKIIWLISWIRKNKYDYLIDPKDHYSTESRIIAGLVRAEIKIGFNPQGKSHFNRSIPSDTDNKGLHFIKRCLNPLKYLDISIPAGNPKPELFENPDSEEYAKEFLKENKIGKMILINISASQNKKMWSNDNWIILLNELNRSYGEIYKFVLTFAPSERQNADNIKQSCSFADLFNSGSIADVISIVKRAELLITPDTSVVHIAAAFNVPIVGLFSNLPEFYSRFHPLSDEFEVVFSEPGIDGIRNILPVDVIEAVKKNNQ
jgi:ADP-heptose:LPS heptosyltransferase